MKLHKCIDCQHWGDNGEGGTCYAPVPFWVSLAGAAARVKAGDTRATNCSLFASVEPGRMERRP